MGSLFGRYRISGENRLAVGPNQGTVKQRFFCVQLTPGIFLRPITSWYKKQASDDWDEYVYLRVRARQPMRRSIYKKDTLLPALIAGWN